MSTRTRHQRVVSLLEMDFDSLQDGFDRWASM
jgi:hypothetical protein